jgi:hypothetical protein
MTNITTTRRWSMWHGELVAREQWSRVTYACMQSIAAASPPHLHPPCPLVLAPLSLTVVIRRWMDALARRRLTDASFDRKRDGFKARAN